jgi:ornithine cyclodeaminase/alanine dehydrogenase-like protein (mu-crystallin family)
MPVVFGEEAVRARLEMRALIPAVRRALEALSAGDVAQPPRVVVPVAPHGGFLGSMPGFVPHSGALGAKLVTFYPGNRDVPTHNAIIVLFHPETGMPAAVMDGRLITEMRTAAASAVATDLLALPNARTLALLGAGVQARSHLEALRLVRAFEDVRVWSPNRAAAFAESTGTRAVASAEEAVRGADVIVVATASRTPVLQGAWLAPGAHVNAVGAVRPDWRELDDAALGMVRLFVDSREGTLRESGDVIAAPGPVTELGEALLGRAPGRSNDAEITLFKSVGVAVEDLVAAELVLAGQG